MVLGGDGNATADDYCALKRRIGIERSVVVGAAAYGTDNRCLLDALARLVRALAASRSSIPAFPMPS